MRKEFLACILLIFELSQIIIKEAIMKKFITFVGLLAAMLVMQLAYSAPSTPALAYRYSYVFADATVVTGSFSGIASGNRITSLSDISASINGVALNGSGHLYPSSFGSADVFGWTSGGAVASFDGLENNFMFIDADFPNSYSYTNFFYDIRPAGRSVYVTANHMAAWTYDAAGGVADGTWKVTLVHAVPEPVSALLLGLGMAALVAARRRNTR